MDIRASTKSDLPKLAAMNFQLIVDEGHGNPMGVVELEERMKGWLESEYTAAIIENEGVVVGYVLWREEDESVYVRQFFISSDERRNGFGRNAIESLKSSEWSGKPIRLDVLINNGVGLAFWRSVGFVDYCVTMQCENL